MRFFTLSVALVFLAATPALRAQGDHHSGGAEAVGTGELGQVHFPTSCSPGVQTTFEEGVALLHSFQYAASDQAFKKVTAEDAGCAIAYWGQAMTLWHSLWDRPDAATLKQGHDELTKAVELNAKTAREREYIAAAAAFYRDDPKPDYAARTAAYSAAMGKLHEDYPADGEAAAFYALSLIALPAHGDQDLSNRKKAIAILDPLFAAEPDHPGAAHYLIHACDTPQLAPQGLAAARRYAKIAPSSSHALHMPSHIFTRLGLWQESIDSNLAAAAAAAQATQIHLGDAHYQLHPLSFLEYAYLQSGRNADAQAVIEEVKRVPGASAGEIADNQAIFRARYALETHDWKMAASLVPPEADSGAAEITWWVRSMGAARMGDEAEARADVSKLAAATTAAQSRSKREGYDVKDEKTIDQLEAEAWLTYAEGKRDDALKALRAVADREDREGVDSLSMSAREMLGDMLMESNQSGAALAAYQTALQESPNRLDALQGVQVAEKASVNGQPAAGSK